MKTIKGSSRQIYTEPYTRTIRKTTDKAAKPPSRRQSVVALLLPGSGDGKTGFMSGSDQAFKACELLSGTIAAEAFHLSGTYETSM
jgi:hypothetical protein